METYVGGTGIIILSPCGNKVLLGKRGDGQGWGLAGGKTEEGENSLQCVMRELTEEFGISVDPWDVEEVGKIFARASIRGKECNVISTIFKASKYYGEIKPRQGEVAEIRWCSCEDILNIDKIFEPSMVALNRFMLDNYKD